VSRAFAVVAQLDRATVF